MFCMQNMLLCSETEYCRVEQSLSAPNIITGWVNGQSRPMRLYFGLILVKNIQEFWAPFWATFSHSQDFWALFGLLLMANCAPKFLRTWQRDR